MIYFQDYFQALGRNGSKPRALSPNPVAVEGFGAARSCSQPFLGILGLAQSPGNVPRSQAAAQMRLSTDPVTGIMEKSLPAIPNPHLITWPGASSSWRQKTLRAFGNSYRELFNRKVLCSWAWSGLKGISGLHPVWHCVCTDPAHCWAAPGCTKTWRKIIYKLSRCFWIDKNINCIYKFIYVSIIYIHKLSRYF